MTTAAVIDNALIARILHAALAELRRPIDPKTGNGWTREAYGQQHSCKCAAGAIRFAIASELGQPPVTDDTLWFSKWYDVCDAVCDRLCAGAGIDVPLGERAPGYGCFEGYVIDWNDRHVETFSEVETAFEKAIAITEAAA